MKTENKERFRPGRVAPLYANHAANKLYVLVDFTPSVGEYHTQVSHATQSEIGVVPNQGILIT